MAEVTISCKHYGIVTKAKAKAPRPSGRNGTLTIRSIEHVVENLTYVGPDGRELVTPDRTVGEPTISEPLNPFCPRCRVNFVNRLMRNLGFTRRVANCKLIDLCDSVIHKLNCPNDRDFDYYDHKVMRCIEYETIMPELFLKWIQDGLVAERNALNYEAAVKTLERVEIYKLVEDENCAVCLDKMVASTAAKQEVVMKLPCQHAFHNGCIRKWFSENQQSCPVCRFQLQLPN